MKLRQIGEAFCCHLSQKNKIKMNLEREEIILDFTALSTSSAIAFT
jgi:hypothetical protein